LREGDDYWALCEGGEGEMGQVVGEGGEGVVIWGEGVV